VNEPEQGHDERDVDLDTETQQDLDARDEEGEQVLGGGVRKAGEKPPVDV